MKKRISITLFLVTVFIWAGCNLFDSKETSSTLASMVDENRYLTDLNYISKVRPPDSANWSDVQSYCHDRLEELGFIVELQNYGTGVNIVGIKTGSLQDSGQVIISAHYDSINNTIGADDNATGVAGVLEVAYILSKANYKNTLIIALWDEEETGYLGSNAYAEQANLNNDNILISIVLEMIGYYSDADNSQTYPPEFAIAFPDQIQAVEDNNNRGDFILCTYDEDAASWYDSFNTYALNINLSTLDFPLTNEESVAPEYSELRRSDHAPFWINNFPAVMISDSADYRNPNYHTMNDTVDTLNINFSGQVIKAVVSSAVEMLIID